MLQYNPAIFGNPFFAGANPYRGFSQSNANIFSGINGNALNDLIKLFGFNGNQQGFGGLGNDIFNLSGMFNNQIAWGGPGNDSMFASGIGNWFNLLGGLGNDQLAAAGQGQAGVLNGGIGNDILTSGGFNNLFNLLGGAGNDVITNAGVRNQEVVKGGIGNDVQNITGAENWINSYLGRGYDVANITGNNNHGLIQNAERVVIDGKGNRFYLQGDGKDGRQLVQFGQNAQQNTLSLLGSNEVAIPAGFQRDANNPNLYVDNKGNQVQIDKFTGKLVTV